MKATNLILAGAMVLSSRTFATAEQGRRKDTSNRELNVLMVKVGRNQIGATVNVYQADGSLVINQTMTHRRLFLDFEKEKKGEYTVEVNAKGKKTKYIYVKGA